MFSKSNVNWKWR